MRVATRRMRAFLRAGLPLLDPEWAEGLRLELGWLGQALGSVRDLDVLVDHLREDSSDLEPGERRALRRVFRHLESERSAARETMLVALGSERYLSLLDRLESAVANPAFGPEERPLQELADGEFRKLRKAGRNFTSLAPAARHEVRIHAKRLRYGLEFFAGVLPRAEVKRHLAALTRLLDLGI